MRWGSRSVGFGAATPRAARAACHARCKIGPQARGERTGNLIHPGRDAAPAELAELPPESCSWSQRLTQLCTGSSQHRIACGLTSKLWNGGAGNRPTTFSLYRVVCSSSCSARSLWRGSEARARHYLTNQPVHASRAAAESPPSCSWKRLRARVQQEVSEAWRRECCVSNGARIVDEPVRSPWPPTLQNDAAVCRAQGAGPPSWWWRLQVSHSYQCANSLALCLPVDATYQCHARGYRQPAMDKGMAWRGPTSTAVGAGTPRSYLVYTAYPNVPARAPHRSARPSCHVAPPTPHNHQPNGCLLSGERRRCRRRRWAGADP